jgi:hypothetical protein
VQQKKKEIFTLLKQKEIEKVYRVVQVAESVDLAFVLDATQSMRIRIQEVKANMRHIANQILRTHVNLNLRLAVVVYRDIEYGKKRVEVLDFVTSVEEFELFVCQIVAVDKKGRSAPRDGPEDMAIGLQEANFLSWMHPTSVVYLIADSPCHGYEFHQVPHKR